MVPVFDRDNSGFIDANELRKVMKELGETLTDRQLRDMMDAADLNGDGKIDYIGNNIPPFSNPRCGTSHIDLGQVQYVETKVTNCCRIQTDDEARIPQKMTKATENTATVNLVQSLIITQTVFFSLE